MNKLNYKNEYIETVNTLTPIVAQYMFNIDGDQVKLRGNNDSGNCLFILKAPKENFDFSNGADQEKLCVLDYTKFYKIYKEFDNADEDSTKSENTELDLEKNDESNEYVIMNISSSKNPCKFKYRLANSSVVKKPVIKDNPVLPDFVTSLKFSKNNVSSIMHRIGMIEATDVKFELTGDECKIVGVNKMTKQEYSEIFKLDKAVENPINVTIMANAFNLLPTADYVINFSEKPLIKYDQVRTDDIELTLYMTTLKSEN